MGRQKVPKSDFQSHFSMSKIIQIFLIFFSLKIISLEEGFCYCHFLKTSIFEPLLFLKSQTFQTSTDIDRAIIGGNMFIKCWQKALR